ncbi:hypothetical protein JTB14_014980 [Gonioctena quinquepunctata]|nr:hypothetical protein JTB14_014980 [Gonioctena quinquepunctata]
MMRNEHKYKCEQENVLAHLKEADHKNYIIFMRNMEEKQKIAKQGSQTPSTVKNKEEEEAYDTIVEKEYIYKNGMEYPSDLDTYSQEESSSAEESKSEEMREI